MFAFVCVSLQNFLCTGRVSEVLDWKAGSHLLRWDWKPLEGRIAIPGSRALGPCTVMCIVRAGLLSVSVPCLPRMILPPSGCGMYDVPPVTRRLALNTLLRTVEALCLPNSLNVGSSLSRGGLAHRRNGPEFDLRLRTRHAYSIHSPSSLRLRGWAQAHT